MLDCFRLFCKVQTRLEMFNAVKRTSLAGQDGKLVFLLVLPTFFVIYYVMVMMTDFSGHHETLRYLNK